jgi:hypothetical protein
MLLVLLASMMEDCGLFISLGLSLGLSLRLGLSLSLSLGLCLFLLLFFVFACFIVRLGFWTLFVHDPIEEHKPSLSLSNFL